MPAGSAAVPVRATLRIWSESYGKCLATRSHGHGHFDAALVDETTAAVSLNRDETYDGPDAPQICRPAPGLRCCGRPLIRQAEFQQLRLRCGGGGCDHDGDVTATLRMMMGMSPGLHFPTGPGAEKTKMLIRGAKRLAFVGAHSYDFGPPGRGSLRRNAPGQ